MKLRRKDTSTPPQYAAVRPAATPIKRDPKPQPVVQEPVEELEEKPTLPNLADLFGLNDRQKKRRKKRPNLCQPRSRLLSS